MQLRYNLSNYLIDYIKKIILPPGDSSVMKILTKYDYK